MFESNENSFTDQAQAAATGLVNLLTAITPLFLVVVIVGIATFNGWLEYIYYASVIGGLAWIPGFLFAFMRFGSGLGGIKLFKSGHVMPGLFFLMVSIGLTFWTASHVPKMGQSLAIVPEMAEHATWLFRTLLWTALIGEVMIAIYMSTYRVATPKRNTATDDATTKATPTETFTTARNIATETGAATVGRNGATPGNGIYNETAQQGATDTDETFFRGSLRRAQQKAATPSSLVSNDVSRKDAYLLQEELDKARNNLRAYKSKLRNGNGTPETLQRGVAKWSARVADLEAQLQDA